VIEFVDITVIRDSLSGASSSWTLKPQLCLIQRSYSSTSGGGGSSSSSSSSTDLATGLLAVELELSTAISLSSSTLSTPGVSLFQQQP